MSSRVLFALGLATLFSGLSFLLLSPPGASSEASSSSSLLPLNKTAEFRALYNYAERLQRIQNSQRSKSSVEKSAYLNRVSQLFRKLATDDSDQPGLISRRLERRSKIEEKILSERRDEKILEESTRIDGLIGELEASYSVKLLAIDAAEIAELEQIESEAAGQISEYQSAVASAENGTGLLSAQLRSLKSQRKTTLRTSKRVREPARKRQAKRKLRRIGQAIKRLDKLESSKLIELRARRGELAVAEAALELKRSEIFDRHVSERASADTAYSTELGTLNAELSSASALVEQIFKRDLEIALKLITELRGAELNWAQGIRDRARVVVGRMPLRR